MVLYHKITEMSSTLRNIYSVLHNGDFWFNYTSRRFTHSAISGINKGNTTMRGMLNEQAENLITTL